MSGRGTHSRGHEDSSSPPMPTTHLFEGKMKRCHLPAVLEKEKALGSVLQYHFYYWFSLLLECVAQDNLSYNFPPKLLSKYSICDNSFFKKCIRWAFYCWCFVLFALRQGLLCNPGWPGTSYIDQAGLSLAS